MSALIVLFFIYFISMHLSVAGMETLIAVLSVSTVAMSLKHKKFLMPGKVPLIAMGGLLTTAAISFWLNIQKPGEFLDYMGEFRWMIAYIVLIQFFNLCYQKINFSKLVLAGQITLIFAGFYSFYQFFTAHDPFRKKVVFHLIYAGSPYFRPNSFFGLPTTYAYASAMFLCVSLAFWIREKRNEPRWMENTRKFYFIMSPVNIFLTFTRAAWIAAIASSMTILRINRHRFFARIGILLLVLIPAVYTSFSSFQNRIDSMFSSTYVGNENRIYLWKANWIIFKEYPLFGIGFDENRKQIDSYLDRFNRPEIMRNHPHNTYLNFLAGLGIFGLGFFLLFVGYNLVSTIQGIRKTTTNQHKTIFIGALGLQMVLLIGGLTECNFEDLELAHQYILFTALVEYLQRSYGDLS